MHGKTSKSRIEFMCLLQTYKTEMDDTRDTGGNQSSWVDCESIICLYHYLNAFVLVSKNSRKFVLFSEQFGGGKILTKSLDEG